MDKLHLDQHISGRFNADLEEIKSQMMEMGGLVEQQVAKAILAVESADTALADQVRETENTIDRMDTEIDDACTQILARRQPAASDLRMVLAVTKSTLDLERIGDEANKIAKMAIQLSDDGTSPRGYNEIRHIGNSVRIMLHNTLDAFARYDTEAALKVARDDREVDQEYRTALRELITYMMEDPRSITRVMKIIWTLRSLERIGDHARNIAEQIIYLVKGKNVRHDSLKEMEKKVND